MTPKRICFLLVILLVIPAVFFGTGALCTASEDLSFEPVSHASFAIKSSGQTLFVDPVGDKEAWVRFGAPDIILITDIHRDHLDTGLVKDLSADKTVVVGPKAAIDALGSGRVIQNGEQTTANTIKIDAIPMYNTTKDRLGFHPKGRGNGYVLTLDSKRIYISGDTEDIPEMRELKGIDYAFICMNLPYTMTVDQAVSATLEMGPAVAFPYHFRGKDGKSDVNRFKTMVEEKSGTKVRLLKWYD